MPLKAAALLNRRPNSLPVQTNGRALGDVAAQDSQSRGGEAPAGFTASGTGRLSCEGLPQP